MPADRFVLYHTEEEARAYAEGVRFVNDGGIEVAGLFLIPKDAVHDTNGEDTFVVHLTDADSPKEESDEAPEELDSPLTRSLLIG